MPMLILMLMLMLMLFLLLLYIVSFILCITIPESRVLTLVYPYYFTEPHADSGADM